MEQSPEEHAAAKLAQHLAVSVQVAESVMRLRQQRTEREADRNQHAAAAARAERITQHTADRVIWSGALDREWLKRATLHDLGRAWGAATGWADTDPLAERAAQRVETRLAQDAPEAMAHFDRLRTQGWDRTEAMQEVLYMVATEATAARQAATATAGSQPDPAASDRQETTRTATDAQAETAAETAADGVDAQPETAVDRAVRWASVNDEAAYDKWQIDHQWAQTPAGHENADTALLATWRTHTQPSARRTTESGEQHPVDVVGDSYPHKFTTVTPAPPTTIDTTAKPAAASRTRSLSR